jgi:hypothetical protein
VIRLNGGDDVIADLRFQNKTTVRVGKDDQIDLTALSFTDYSDVHDQMTQVGKNVVMDLGDGNSLQINNVTIGMLDAHAGDFVL